MFVLFKTSSIQSDEPTGETDCKGCLCSFYKLLRVESVLYIALIYYRALFWQGQIQQIFDIF